MKKAILEKCLLMGLVFIFLGCRESSGPVTDTSVLDRQVTALVLDTLDACRSRLPDIAPAAVVPQSLMEGQPYSRLEELIVDQLSEKIAEDREVVSLSRENWFELRESRPLSLRGHHPDMAPLMDNLVVFLVSVEPEPLLDRITARIRVADSGARIMPGIEGKRVFSNRPEAAARVLLDHPARDVQAPEGLKENPFHSLEELSYSMVTELRHALEKGLTAAGAQAGEEEIQVVLSSGNTRSEDPGFNRALLQELQQALVSVGGITSAVSRTDFSTLFDQVNFYNQNPGSAGLFEVDEEPFKPGSVILMAETRSDPGSSARKVSLRAMWRVSPMRDADGEIITGNAAGTYVADFASRAWFKGPAPSAAAMVFSGPAPRHRIAGDKGFD